jgi:hypothetical protein
VQDPGSSPGHDALRVRLAAAGLLPAAVLIAGCGGETASVGRSQAERALAGKVAYTLQQRADPAMERVSYAVDLCRIENDRASTCLGSYSLLRTGALVDVVWHVVTRTNGDLGIGELQESSTFGARAGSRST